MNLIRLLYSNTRPLYYCMKKGDKNQIVGIFYKHNHSTHNLLETSDYAAYLTIEEMKALQESGLFGRNPFEILSRQEGQVIYEDQIKLAKDLLFPAFHRKLNTSKYRYWRMRDPF